MTTPSGEDHPFELRDLVIRPITETDLRALEWDGVYSSYRRMYADLYQDAQSGRVLMWMVENLQGEMIGQVFVMLHLSLIHI